MSKILNFIQPRNFPHKLMLVIGFKSSRGVLGSRRVKPSLTLKCTFYDHSAVEEYMLGIQNSSILSQSNTYF